MTKRIHALLTAHAEQLAYLVVGGMTTLVNYAVYVLLTAIAGLYYIAGNGIAWVAAVAFSYLASGRWVYRSTGRRGWREAGEFALSRLFSLGLETALLLVLVKLLAVNQLAAKLLAAVVVVVVNYWTGLLVFKRKKGGADHAFRRDSGL